MTTPAHTITRTGLLEAALSYASRGWQVFPLCPNKRTPRTGRGLYDATTDPERIREWWAAWPDANVGVRTGAQSGLFVLAVDCDERGLSSLTRLEAEDGALPETHRVRTEAGAQHYFFRVPDAELGGRIRPGRLGPGLSVRGDGEYVVAAPSCDATGEAGTIVVDPRLAEPPSWLVEKLRPPQVDVATNGSSGDDEASPAFVTGTELFRSTDAPIDWLARPCLAAGSLAFLAGERRVGKTTFALTMVRALLEGSAFLDEATRPSRVVYVTDQPQRSLKLALRRVGLTEERGRDLHILFCDRHERPSWEPAADAALERCVAVGANVLIVDALGSFVGTGRDIAPHDAPALMQPLGRSATEHELGVLVVEPADALAAETELTAWMRQADHVLAMHWPDRRADATIRAIDLSGHLLEDPQSIEVSWTRQRGYELVVDGQKLRQQRVRETLYRLLLIEGGAFRKARLADHPWMAGLDVEPAELRDVLALELELGRVEERRAPGRGRPVMVKLMRRDEPDAAELGC